MKLMRLPYNVNEWADWYSPVEARTLMQNAGSWSKQPHCQCEEVHKMECLLRAMAPHVSTNAHMMLCTRARICTSRMACLKRARSMSCKDGDDFTIASTQASVSRSVSEEQVGIHFPSLHNHDGR